MGSNSKSFLYFFAALSAIGLALSVVSHVASLLGALGPLGRYSFALHVGVFIVWGPAVLVTQQLAKDASRGEVWKIVLRGCPAWMKYMTYGLVAYAILNFALYMYREPKPGAPDGMSPRDVRGFSGHWMVFYSAALAILYSAAKVREQGGVRRCPNGHAVAELAKFCSQCGQPVGLSQPQFRL